MSLGTSRYSSPKDTLGHTGHDGEAQPQFANVCRCYSGEDEHDLFEIISVLPRTFFSSTDHPVCVQYGWSSPSRHKHLGQWYDVDTAPKVPHLLYDCTCLINVTSVGNIFHLLTWCDDDIIIPCTPYPMYSMPCMPWITLIIALRTKNRPTKMEPKKTQSGNISVSPEKQYRRTDDPLYFLHFLHFLHFRDDSPKGLRDMVEPESLP